MKLHHQSRILDAVNIYAPVKPDERLSFFQSLNLGDVARGTDRVCLGDFNDCPDVTVDRARADGTSYPVTPASHWGIFRERASFEFIDSIRTFYPLSPAFSRPHYRGMGSSKRVVSWSRIDHILIPKGWKRKVVDARTLFTAPCSDHRPVLVTVDLLPNGVDTTLLDSLPTTGDYTHRLNPAIFDDPAFVESIPGLIDGVYDRLHESLEAPEIFDQVLKEVMAAGQAFNRN